MEMEVSQNSLHVCLFSIHTSALLAFFSTVVWAVEFVWWFVGVTTRNFALNFVPVMIMHTNEVNERFWKNIQSLLSKHLQTDLLNDWLINKPQSQSVILFATHSLWVAGKLELYLSQLRVLSGVHPGEIASQSQGKENKAPKLLNYCGEGTVMAADDYTVTMLLFRYTIQLIQ